MLFLCDSSLSLYDGENGVHCFSVCINPFYILGGGGGGGRSPAVGGGRGGRGGGGRGRGNPRDTSLIGQTVRIAQGPFKGTFEIDFSIVSLVQFI